MNSLRALYQLSLADFRERTRRTGFVVTMLGVLFFAYLVITGKYTVQFGEFRTLYHSAWAGTLMAVTASIMLTLVGFYLIRGTITRDRMRPGMLSSPWEMTIFWRPPCDPSST